MQPLLGHEGSSNHNLPGAEFPPSKLGTKELLDDGVVGFEFGVLSRGGAVQEGAGMFMVDFTVDVGEIAPILLGSFLAIGTSDFKAFGDGVSRGSAQVMRKPGGLLPNQGDGGLIGSTNERLAVIWAPSALAPRSALATGPMGNGNAGLSERIWRILANCEALRGDRANMRPRSRKPV